MSTMLEDLEEVVAAQSNPKEWIGVALKFMDTHHATIAQNAEDSKRLKALEQAMDEVELDGYQDDEMEAVHRRAVADIRNRADEIMRGGE